MLKPTDRTLLVTHKNCLDGTGSAFVFVKAGGLQANVRFRLPNNCVLKPNDVMGLDEVWFVDVCPSDLTDPAGGLPFRVIDHHVTNVRRFDGDPRCTFSLDHSGTSLLAREVGLVGFDRLVRALEAYDLGRFHDADGMLLADLASTYAQDEMLNRLVGRLSKSENLYDSHPILDSEYFVARAEGVAGMRDDWARRCARSAYVFILDDNYALDDRRFVAALAVCPPNWTNAVSQAIMDRDDFRYCGADVSVQVAVCVDPNGGQVSLRTRDDAVDCSRIAEGFGGGGHRKAAGFRTVGGTGLRGLIEEIFE